MVYQQGQLYVQMGGYTVAQLAPMSTNSFFSVGSNTYVTITQNSEGKQVFNLFINFSTTPIEAVKL
ncbi:hypothetical protein [Pseudoalteromonas luteoviolacea]|uniref:hypothetical protein n=1 Tax=Pseudoalteromonas luteoviolacea TaxID=43657 RepID=UPI001FFD597E|nr:hypothetical protein [Pseudoalteromonas luteoviolacea]